MVLCLCKFVVKWFVCLNLLRAYLCVYCEIICVFELLWINLCAWICCEIICVFDVGGGARPITYPITPPHETTCLVWSNFRAMIYNYLSFKLVYFPLVWVKIDCLLIMLFILLLHHIRQLALFGQTTGNAWM